MKTMTQHLAITVFVLTAIFGLRGIARAEVAATGGDVTEIGVDGTAYRVHAFTTTGTNTLAVTTGGEVDIIVVAGGGGGGGVRNGSGICGGGGGGGVVLTNLTVEAGSNYTVVIGDGGANSADANTRGSNGDDSWFDTVQAIGGGGGGSASGEQDGADGGSGGGDAGNRDTDVGGSGTPGQGHDGGGSDAASTVGKGGGGGANEPGSKATSSSNGGHGGDGTNMTYLVGTGFGEDGWFGGGGAGGGDGLYCDLITGGMGGGGDWKDSGWYPPGDPGLPATGGGGAGGGSEKTRAGAGGDGGSGVVIVRYEADVEFVEFLEPVTLANITTGSEEFTNSNKVEITALPVPEGYTHYQVTESGDLSALSGSWTATNTLLSPTFTTPSADTNVTLYAWYTNMSSAVLLQRGQNSIYYTTVAPPDPPVSATRFALRPPDQPIEIQLDFLDAGATGGEADGRAMAVFARRVESDDENLDQTPGEAYLTLAGTESDGDYPLRLWVQNEAGNTTLSSSTMLLTVETYVFQGVDTNDVSYLGGYYDGWDRDDTVGFVSLERVSPATILMVR